MLYKMNDVNVQIDTLQRKCQDVDLQALSDRLVSVTRDIWLTDMTQKGMLKGNDNR